MSKFAEGQLVRVVRANWTDGSVSGLSVKDTDRIAKVESGADYDGDCFVRIGTEEDGNAGYVGECNLEAIESKPNVGTATVTVELRFLLGDKDITDAIKGLVNA